MGKNSIARKKSAAEKVRAWQKKNIAKEQSELKIKEHKE